MGNGFLFKLSLSRVFIPGTSQNPACKTVQQQ